MYLTHDRLIRASFWDFNLRVSKRSFQVFYDVRGQKSLITIFLITCRGWFKQSHDRKGEAGLQNLATMVSIQLLLSSIHISAFQELPTWAHSFQLWQPSQRWISITWDQKNPVPSWHVCFPGRGCSRGMNNAKCSGRIQSHHRRSHQWIPVNRVGARIRCHLVSLLRTWNGEQRRKFKGWGCLD